VLGVATGHLERLAAALDRLLLALVLVRVAGDLFEVEIGDVGVHRRHTPGDAVVVADHDAGHTGEREPGDVIRALLRDLPAVQADLIPDARHGRCQVWIVGEDRLAGG
jgi:hypothetical protein